MDNNIIKSVVYSEFTNQGPTPKIYWPEDLDEMGRTIIAMKTISLLMGDSVYQDGFETEGINYFGIIPFPDLQLQGLTYFFLIEDLDARGNAKAATITVLVDENNKSFFYENMKYLRVIIDNTASKIQESKAEEQLEKVIEELKIELFNFTSELRDPFSSKRQIKVLFIGLDKAGKTSFLFGVKQKYSEIIKAMPTKGVNREQEHLFSEESSQISIWDLGGQAQYRKKYLEQSKIYLYDVDLIFYFVDIQDSERIDEAMELYKKVIQSLKEIDEYPPIVVCLNKYDPDIKDVEFINFNIEKTTKFINRYSEEFIVKIFKTSIFSHWSLISAYSYGLSQLSPNRELFNQQLKNFSNKTNADAIILLNENGIILSNYSKDEISGKVFEISAPHFKTLYKTFKEFKILKEDLLVSSGITDDSKILIFKKIKVDKYNLYLLLLIEKNVGITKIEDNLPFLTENLVQLINTYL